MERESEVEGPAQGGAGGEELYHLRLLALLHDLVREKNRDAVATDLGVDPRTLSNCLDRAQLSRRMREALEGVLLDRNSSELGRHGERLDALEQQVSALAERDPAGRQETQAVMEAWAQALREEWDQRAGTLEERLLSRLQPGRSEGVREQAQGAAGEARPAARTTRRREYPDLVTIEPAPDDEQAFGEAWPRVKQWRDLRQGHPNRGRSLSWLKDEERIRGLEVEMLQTHGMTLPPETYPLRGIARDSQLSWRRKALYDTRKRRIKRQLLRWVRDVLTLGIWRK